MSARPADMSYLGLTYQTLSGSYSVPYSSSLTLIGTHTFGDTQRPEAVTEIDPGIQEAYQDYPSPRPWEEFENFSRSFYTIDGHMRSLMMYQTPHRIDKPDDPSWEAVDAHCSLLFDTFPKVQSLDFNYQLKEVPFIPSSSPGIGYQGKKGDGDNLKTAIKRAVATVHNFADGNVQHVMANTTPDKAFTRTQLTDTAKKLKVRHVFGQAFQYILLEGLAAAPLIKMFSSINNPIFIGIDPRIGVPNFIEFLMKQGLNMISTDWTGFDQTVEYWEIEDAFALLKTLITFPNDLSRAAFEFTRLFFLNRKIAAPRGQLFFKVAGFPSGSYYTSLIGSLINYRRIQYMHHRLTGRLVPSDNIKVLGDDALFGTTPDSNVTPHRLSEIAAEYFPKWNLNPDKMKTGQSGDMIEFLQRRLWLADQARDIVRVERLAMFPEHPVTDKRISAYRARALWEDGNYSSNFLAHAVSFLETKYGTLSEEEVPQFFKDWKSRVVTPFSTPEEEAVSS